MDRLDRVNPLTGCCCERFTLLQVSVIQESCPRAETSIPGNSGGGGRGGVSSITSIPHITPVILIHNRFIYDSSQIMYSPVLLYYKNYMNTVI